VIGATLALALATPVFASVPIDWDPIYTWEPGATATNSPAGGILSGVGVVSKFDVPFQDLDASDPTKEYTIYLTGLVSQGTTFIGPVGQRFFTTNYTGGTIYIYEDLSPDLDYGVNPPNATSPSTFTDGTLLLQGNFTSFVVQTNDFTTFQVGNMEGNINWTGGSLYDRTITGGQPCPGLFTGGITWRSSVLIPGYIFRHDGKIDLNCPVPAQSSTWGKIKASYR
jgi:hypothetical protein